MVFGTNSRHYDFEEVRLTVRFISLAVSADSGIIDFESFATSITWCRRDCVRLERAVDLFLK